MKGKSTKSPLNQESLAIKSEFNNINKVENFSQIIARKARLTQDQSDNMAIVLTELVNNAIIHGNKQDSNKKVMIEAVYYSDRVEVSVKDEGEGFNPTILKDPTDPENLWKESGRGIFLVKNLIDDIKFQSTPHGMEIKIIQYYTN